MTVRSLLNGRKAWRIKKKQYTENLKLNLKEV
jgi:hypothetical protein